jgi:hypothetical protein
MKASQPAVDDSSSGLDRRRFLTVATASGFAMGPSPGRWRKCTTLWTCCTRCYRRNRHSSHPLVQIARDGTVTVTINWTLAGACKTACQ